MRVLVVEDEDLLADAIARGLHREAIAADIALDGDEALYKASLTAYDVIVLDRDLPGTHGDDVCRQLVADGYEARILMLTAASEIQDRVAGLNIGADDYLGKPFAFDELIARVRALGRRPSSPPPTLARGDLVLDPSHLMVTRAGRPIGLARREIAVLDLLIRADGAVLSAEELLERAWDENADPFSNAVRVTVARLRRKLGPPAIIETVVGSGYRLK